MPTFLMPQLGESDVEGTVLRWLKQPGEHVRAEEPLVEVETEKVNVEIPSPFEGTLTSLLVAEGEKVPVGSPLAVIGEESVATAPAPVTMPAAPAASSASNGFGSALAGATSEREAVQDALEEPPVAAAEGREGASDGVGRSELPAPAAAVATGPAPTAPAAPATNGSYGSAPPAGEAAGRYSPAVLRLAQEFAVDLKAISGSGLGGRVTRKDVMAFIEGRSGSPGGSSGAAQPVIASSAPPMVAAPAPAAPPPTAPTPSPVGAVAEAAPPPPTAAGPADIVPGSAAARPAAELPAAPARPAPAEDEEIVTPSATRLTIARTMTRAAAIPSAWMAVEVDVTGLVALRTARREAFRQREGIDLTYLPFAIQAVIEALREQPLLNSQWRDDQIVLKKRINISVAVGTDDGLAVPVIQHADRLSLVGLAHAVSDLATRARARTLRLEDVQGGTFTVDNTGVFGSTVSRPIINPPQCAILTTEAIVKRVVVHDDAIAIRSLMNCCVAFDHRIVDGVEVGAFMQAVKRRLEAYGPDSAVL